LIPAPVRRAAFQPDHDVEAAQRAAAAAKHFPYHTLDTVTVDSSRGHFLAGDDSDTGLPQAVGPGKYHEMTARARRSLRQRRRKLFRPPQSGRSRQTEWRGFSPV